MSTDTPGKTELPSDGGGGERVAASRSRRFFRRVSNTEWILGEVEATQQLIERLVDESGQTTTAQESWRDTAAELLRETEESVNSNEEQRAWLTLKAAKRACLYGMNKEEILARSVVLHNEAEKIDFIEHRAAIQETLNLYGKPLSNTDLVRLFDPDLEKSDGKLKEVWAESAKVWREGPEYRPAGVDALVVASEIRDEYHNDLWRRIDRRQNAIMTSILSLGATTFLLVGFWEIWNCIDWFDVRFKDRDISLLIVALFGALGASLSTAYTLVSADLPNKYTEGAMNIVVTIARPLIGAAAAVAILFIYAGGLLDGVLKPDAIEENVVFALAFTSGFTERLIFSATNKIVEKTQG